MKKKFFNFFKIVIHFLVYATYDDVYFYILYIFSEKMKKKFLKKS